MIHRANLNGKPECGAPSGKVSMTGACVTCPACVKASQPLTREESMR